MQKRVFGPKKSLIVVKIFQFGGKKYRIFERFWPSAGSNPLPMEFVKVRLFGKEAREKSSHLRPFQTQIPTLLQYKEFLLGFTNIFTE